MHSNSHASQKRKSSNQPSLKVNIVNKLLKQILISGIILMSFLIIRTNSYAECKIKENISQEYDIKTIYKNFIYNIDNNIKEIQQNNIYNKTFLPNGILSVFPSFLTKKVPENVKPSDGKVEIYNQPKVEAKNNSVDIYPQNKIENKPLEQSNNSNNQTKTTQTVAPVMSSFNQLDMDVESVKKSGISFIKPVNGQITSPFGARTPNGTLIFTYHSGLDLKASTGDPIKASINGSVLDIAETQYLGKHVIVKNNNIVTLYAHCSKILVKKGQTVKQGQIIANVGMTGLTTGPHLHFEIKYNDRLVDPQKIIF